MSLDTCSRAACSRAACSRAACSRVNHAPSLLDLPDDMLRAVLGMCTARALTCLASTCRHLRALGSQVDMPVVSLTCKQSPDVILWLWLPSVCHRVRALVARRCLADTPRWLPRLDGLRDLTLLYCRVNADLVDQLPASLTSLELHQVVPRAGRRHGIVGFRRLRALRALRVTFHENYDAIFVKHLPRGLRQLRLRGGKAMVVESFMPRGLRDVALSSRCILMCSNRLPRGVRSLRLECTEGRVWIVEVLPHDLRRLESLALRSPHTAWLPRVSEMTRLRALRVETNTLVTDWKALSSLPLLEHLELHTKQWMGFTLAQWPARPARRPRRVTVSIAGINITRSFFESTSPRSGAPG